MLEQKEYKFKAREMPHYPEPNSPSRKSLASNTTRIEFQEFNLCTDKRQRERLSLPLYHNTSMRSVTSHGGALHGFVAQPMPDFIKLHQQAPMMKPREVQVTKPLEFKFKVDKRGEDHQKELQEKLKREQEELERQRQFRAREIPDYDKLKVDIMPSEKPLTQSLRPVFHADFLPPPVFSRKSMEPTKKEGELPDFKF